MCRSIRTTPRHGICPYSKATRGNVDVAFTVNGLPVTETDRVAA